MEMQILMQSVKECDREKHNANANGEYMQIERLEQRLAKNQKFDTISVNHSPKSLQVAIGWIHHFCCFHFLFLKLPQSE